MNSATLSSHLSYLISLSLSLSLSLFLSFSPCRTLLLQQRLLSSTSPAPGTFHDALLLLSTSKLNWPRIQLHFPDMNAIFRLVQQSCPKMCFQAWTLGKEFQDLWQWCCSALPPQLLLLEQTVRGRLAWTPVTPASALRLPVGSEVQVRCWILGATQYTWTTTTGNAVASTEVHCARHHTGKSEIALQSRGRYQCVATAADGRTSDPVQFEVVAVAHEEEGHSAFAGPGRPAGRHPSRFFGT